MTGQFSRIGRPLPPERIEIEGLIIRRWTANDVDARVHAIAASLEHLRPWLPWSAQPQLRPDQEAFLRRSDNGWEAGDNCDYGVFDAVSSELLAAVGLHNRVGPGAREMGYWVHVGHTGQGVITRAVAAVTRAALAVDGIQRIEIHCDQANTRSVALAGRLGYQLTRTEIRPIRTPAESGRWQIWVTPVVPGVCMT
jgi:RimJ/RimL family protein N-acetyltransferase